MTRERLVELIRKRESLLCVGLDTDIDRIPEFLRKEKHPLFAFNKQIIDATREACVSYKLNTAFYEAHGSKGWEEMHMTAEYIGEQHFKIADAKRGDIGNTAKMYERAFFENMTFDAITLSPYMGKDSIEPFLKKEDKWAIVLGHTSNEGAADLQKIKTENGNYFYEETIKRVSSWGKNLMFVVGATKPEAFESIRKLIPELFLLVPGIGAQGGDLEAVLKAGLNDEAGLLINSSRGIIYASDGNDFAEAAGIKAFQMRDEMRAIMNTFEV